MLRKKVAPEVDLSRKFPGGPIDHSIMRGAKKGGITDHIAGPHLIPNVGREAMVPAEIVSRRQHKAPKKKPEPPKAAPKQKEKAPKRKEHRFKERDEPSNRKDRKHYSDDDSTSESRHRDRDRSLEVDRLSDAGQARKRLEEQTMSEELDKRRQEEEERRFQEEQRKMKELEEVRKKKQEIDSERKKKLGGLFALTEEDMAEEDNADAQKARIAQERARAMERRAQERAPPEEVKPAAYERRVAVVASVPSAASSAGPIVDDGNITAVDLDGSQHDHKFSKVWKDWDASKKSDPGEVARQFMKIAAIKRRGYTAGGPPGDIGERAGGGRGSGSGSRPPPSPSRSRSRGRRRR